MKNENKQNRANAEKVSPHPTAAGSAIAVGNFDGLHLGHQRLLQTLKEIAAENDLTSMVMTFFPNPRAFFNKELKLIFSDRQKKQTLMQLGVERVEFVHFPDILHFSGEEFVKNVLVEKYRINYIVLGDNFRFGKDRECSIDCLTKMGRIHDFKLRVVEKLVLDGTPISSSLIREKLNRGEIELCNRMLGRPYTIDGTVAEGDKIGRQLGFPTINIDTPNEILPEGVFQTQINVENRTYDSISYIGRRPTFSGTQKKVETHILNFDREIYGQNIRLFFYKKIREDIKFSSRQHLIEQIKKDIRRIKVDKDIFF